ncbi:MAG: Stp1/IreP family PP2C-type Ser/Thr phosphatase, partial [Actinomycetes bacterium]
MELHAAEFTLVGLVRQANEDASMVGDGLVAVADGMGGHLAGEVASADTVTTLRAVVGMRAPGELVGAVHLANRRIHDRAAENPELHGMGTTVCVLGVVVDDGDEKLMVLNVGDSRVYHYGSGVLTQVTEDHSLVEALVRDGRLTPEEAEVHPQRNVLTRALGVEAVVEVDAWVLTPADGDRFLLCSDGLFNEITDGQIAEVLESAKDPDAAARILAERAETAGGRDNITTVVVDV